MPLNAAVFSAVTYKIREVDVEKCAYYVNKIRQTARLET